MHRPGSRRWLLCSALALLVLAWAAALPAAAGKAPLIDPDAFGDFSVGRATFTIIDPARGDRELAVDAWYPVDEADAVVGPSVYDLLLAGLVSPLALEAPAVSSQGPFPLIAFSHGSGGIRFQSFFLAEALASHGFVVVAPDHAGNTAVDALFGGSVPFEASAIDRPLDISFLITRMLERGADPADAFHERIDPERIGVAGHSFGGFTTLAVAAGFVASLPDPRVDAIVPISPVSTLFSDEALAGIQIPMLVLGGSADITTPVEPQSARAFDLASSRPRYRVDILEAGHNSFTDICDIGDVLTAVGLPPEFVEFILGSAEEGCAPELIPIQEAHRLARYYAVAFLQRYVAGDKRYERFLEPGRVRKDGLQVELSVVKGKPKKVKKLKKIKLKKIKLKKAKK